MIKINTISNYDNWNKYLKNPNTFIQNKINNFNKKFKKYKKNILYCTLVLTGSNEIRKLNKNFRKKNKPTDILSFPSFNKIDFKKNIKKNNIYLGDIAISYQEFFKNNKNDLENSFIKIFIHGYLHLLNFNHKSNKDYALMSSVENKLFQIVKGKIDNKKI